MKNSSRTQKLTVIGLACVIFITLTSMVSPKKTCLGFLRGTFIVHCFRCGQNDIVEGITRNHDCERCGNKTVDEGTAYVVCPDVHATRVEGITESHLCTVQFGNGAMCGKQCRR